MNDKEIENLLASLLQGQKELQIAQINLAQRINQTNETVDNLAQRINQTNETVNNLANTVNNLAQVTQSNQTNIQRITGEGIVRDADLSLNNQRFIRIEQRLETIENLIREERNREE